MFGKENENEKDEAETDHDENKTILEYCDEMVERIAKTYKVLHGLKCTFILQLRCLTRASKGGGAVYERIREKVLSYSSAIESLRSTIDGWRGERMASMSLAAIA